MNRKTPEKGEGASSVSSSKAEHGPRFTLGQWFVRPWIIYPSVSAKRDCPDPPGPSSWHLKQSSGWFLLRFLSVLRVHASAGLRAFLLNRVVLFWVLLLSLDFYLTFILPLPVPYRWGEVEAQVFSGCCTWSRASTLWDEVERKKGAPSLSVTLIINLASATQIWRGWGKLVVFLVAW